MVGLRAEMRRSRETLRGQTVDSRVMGHTDEGHRESKEQEQAWAAGRSRTRPSPAASLRHPWDGPVTRVRTGPWQLQACGKQTRGQAGARDLRNICTQKIIT